MGWKYLFVELIKTSKLYLMCIAFTKYFYDIKNLTSYEVMKLFEVDSVVFLHSSTPFLFLL